jgi:hypothetical protein
LEAPVFLFYELNGFYQNHRLYIDSTSINQLKGDILTVEEVILDKNRLVTIVRQLLKILTSLSKNPLLEQI